MAIAFVPASETSQAFVAATSDVMTLASVTRANNLIAVVVATLPSTTVVSVTDSAGNTYVRRIAFSAVPNVELWTTAEHAASAKIVTVQLSASAKASITVGEYSGVGSISGSDTHSAGAITGTVPQDVDLTQDINNWVIAGIAAAGLATFSARTGQLRGSSVTSGGLASTNVGGALNDNTAALAGSVTNAVTLSASEGFAVVSFELRSLPVTGTGGPKPKKRQHIYDVFRSPRGMRAVRRANSDAPLSPVATRVVVAGQLNEKNARAIAKATAQIQWSAEIEEHVIVAVLLEVGEL